MRRHPSVTWSLFRSLLAGPSVMAQQASPPNRHAHTAAPSRPGRRSPRRRPHVHNNPAARARRRPRARASRVLPLWWGRRRRPRLLAVARRTPEVPRHLSRGGARAAGPNRPRRACGVGEHVPGDGVSQTHLSRWPPARADDGLGGRATGLQATEATGFSRIGRAASQGVLRERMLLGRADVFTSPLREGT